MMYWLLYVSLIGLAFGIGVWYGVNVHDDWYQLRVLERERRDEDSD